MQPVKEDKSFRWWAIVLGITGLLCLHSVTAQAAVRANSHGYERDPYYRDINHHWAEIEIKTLWEVNVTDGRVYRSPWGQRRAWFEPDDRITRAQYVRFMARVFQLEPVTPARPSFVDVGPGYHFYNRVRPYPEIEAAKKHGFLLNNSRRFRPHHTMTRQAAFSQLMRALQLHDWSSRMTVREINEQLQRYSDRRRIQPDLRRDLALGTYLGIIKGYPDGTLQPQGSLTRAEAAAVFYRSAMILLQAEPDRFSPDGDQSKETTRIALSTLRNDNVDQWTIRLSNEADEWIQSWSGSTFVPSVTWNGSDRQGHTVEPGIYFYEGSMVDRNGQIYRSVRKPLEVRHHRLNATLIPAAGVPGRTVQLQAQTLGGATAVEFEVFGSKRRLVRQGTDQGVFEWQDWSKTLTIPQDTAAGDYPVQVRALFDNAVRTTRLMLRVKPVAPSLRVYGELIPNPASREQQVRIEAETSGPVEQVVASFPDPLANKQLNPAGASNWRGTFTVPGTWENGVHFIDLTATGEGSQATATLGLEIEGHILDRLAFVLTD